MINIDILTPSQKKLLKDQELWMRDVGQTYTKERTRIDAIEDIMKRFPTERDAREALDVGGDPAVMDWYSRKNSKIFKKRNKKKSLIPQVKCKCK
jgi:hypothetical protein